MLSHLSTHDMVIVSRFAEEHEIHLRQAYDKPKEDGSFINANKLLSGKNDKINQALGRGNREITSTTFN